MNADGSDKPIVLESRDRRTASSGSGMFRDELIPRDTPAADLEDLSRTRNVLLHRPPRFLSATVYVLFFLLVAAVAWAFFGKLEVVVRTNGFVRPENDPVPVHTREGGKIKHVGADVGDRVKKGDVLVTFKSRKLRNTLTGKQSKLRSERRKIDTYRSLQKQLRAELDEFREWATIHEETLKKILRNAENRLERYETYRDTKAISKSEYEKVMQNMRQKKLQLQRLEEKRTDRKAKINRRLRELSVKITSSRGRIDVLQTEIDEITTKLKETKVTAPRDGVIIQGNPQPGQVVSAGGQLFEVASTEALRIDLFVSEHDRNRIENEQNARIRVNAFPHVEYGALTGRVYYISPDLQSPDPNFMRSHPSANEGNAGPRSGGGSVSPGYRVKMRITGGTFRDRLKPGMAVQAELKVEKRRIINVLFRRVRGAISFWDEPGRS